MDVLVIGAGVSGLTTGIRLAEAGLDVTIRTAAPPEQTTSVAAGADPVNPATGAKGAPTPDYTEFETFTLVRTRSDRM